MKESTKLLIGAIILATIGISLLLVMEGIILYKTYDTSITVIYKESDGMYYRLASCDHQYSIDPFIENDFYIYSLFEKGNKYNVQVKETLFGTKYIEKVYDQKNKLCEVTI